MKTLVVYQSSTGFTRQYAQWMGEALACEVKSIKEVNEQMLSGYDLIIHGGWIMGGMINGLDKIRQMAPKQLVAFGVGFSRMGECEQAIVETNHLENTPFYYMEGGFHPKQMGFFKRSMVKAVTKQPVTETDHSDKKFIEPLVEYVRKLA